MLKELSHIGVKTWDLEKSMAFYIDRLGGDVVRDVYSVDGKSRYIYAEIAQCIVELIPAESENDQGVEHTAFLLLDKSLDETFERSVAAGAGVDVAPRTAYSGVGRLCFLTEPSGLRIEIVEREEHLRKDFAGKGWIKNYLYDLLPMPAGQKDAILKIYREGLGMEQRGDDLIFGADTLKYREGVRPEFVLQARDAETLAKLAEGAEIVPDDGEGVVLLSPEGVRVRIVL